MLRRQLAVGWAWWLVLVGVAAAAGCDDGGSPAAKPFDCASCSPNATCDEQARTCTCNEGYDGDGLLCEDVDECAAASFPCLTGSTCLNKPGSFQCICGSGYEIVGSACLDIDECSRGLAACPPNSACLNTPGFYDCQCVQGYALQPGVGCVDTDECKATPFPCDPVAICTNSGGSFACACPTGYTGDGKTCTDIDECASPDACNPTFVCTNKPGGHDCTCPQGSTSDGERCAKPGGDVSIQYGDASFSASSGALAVVHLIAPLNPLANDGGESGTTSWDSGACGSDQWSTSTLDRIFGDAAFIGTSCPASLTQLVDLEAKGWPASWLDSGGSLRLYAMARAWPPKAGDTLWLELDALDKNGKQQKTAAQTPAKPGNAWVLQTLKLDALPQGVRKAKVTLYGQHEEDAAGNQGPLVDGVQLVVPGWQVRTKVGASNWTGWVPFSPETEVKLPGISGQETLTVEFEAPTGERYLASDSIVITVN